MFKKYILLVFAFFIFSACSGTMKNRQMSEILVKNIKEKKYDEALKNTKHNDFYSQENSKLLKNLEIATMYYLRGDYYQSLLYFEQAKTISDDLYTISIKNKMASGWDANLDNYYGERYEKSMIRFYISLINYNLYQQGFYEEYKDENNKIIAKKFLTENEKTFHLNYAKSSVIEWDSLLQSMQNESFGSSIYKNDMIAKIWGGFIHSEYNTANDRQISIQLYKDADDLLLRNYNSYPIFNKKSDIFNKNFKILPNITYQQLYKNYIEETKYSKKLREYITRNKKNLEKHQKDNVAILVKDNLISPKIVKTYKIPFPITSFGPQGSNLYEFSKLMLSTQKGMPYISIEFPEIKQKDNINEFSVIVYNENNEEIASTDLTLIEPLSEIAKKTLDDKTALIKSTIIARITSKYIAAISSAYSLYSRGDSISMIGAIAMFKGASKVINDTSRADIRYWITLYSDAQMGGLKLDNGDYILKIKSNDKVIFEKNIKIEKEKTIFIDLNNI